MILDNLYHSKLERLEHLRNQVKDIYVEINELEKEVKEIWLNDKSLVLESDNYAYNMLWVHSKEIDYNKLEKLYPEIYILGLRPTFSKEHLFHSIDKNLANKVLRECLIDTSEYKLERKRK